MEAGVFTTGLQQHEVGCLFITLDTAGNLLNRFPRFLVIHSTSARGSDAKQGVRIFEFGFFIERLHSGQQCHVTCDQMRSVIRSIFWRLIYAR